MNAPVGCMGGTSLAVTPAFLIGQYCEIVDLDGPTPPVADREPASQYHDGPLWLPDVSEGISIMMTSNSIEAADRPHASGAPRAPVRIIFDTDMWSDVDDVLALAMVHALADREEAELLAVTTSTDDPWSASFVDAVNTFYGRNDIPVGKVCDGVTGDQTLARFPWLRTKQSYPQYLCQSRRADGSLAFPHSLRDGALAPDATTVLRQALATQPDDSVVIVQVGFSTNLARLLASMPDEISGLSGSELVARKVRLLSVMAGGLGDEVGALLAAPPTEFNLILDVPAARTLFGEWPTPIVVSGIEIGLSMRIAGAGLDSDYRYAEHHPVRTAYHYMDPIYRPKDLPPNVLHDHCTFDLTSVLYAVRPNAGYFDMSTQGNISVVEDGSLRFTPSPGGRHRYLTINAAQRARTLEAMTLLASQPPRWHGYSGATATSAVATVTGAITSSAETGAPRPETS